MAVIIGEATNEVDASIERCWALVEDVASAPEWQGGLVRMDVLERDEQGRPSVCMTTSDAKLRKVDARVRFRYEAPERLSWTMLEGELQSMNGAWELEDLGDGRTRVTYRLEVDPGPTPRLLRGPIEAAARAILVNGRPKELGERVAADG
jgi:ribosome-associated toxin RatA of RatAB toxin-antitoxin module